MKPYQIFLTEGAELDLEADQVLDRLLEAAEALVLFPERGAHPRELASLGILDYRQVFFKPYRVIYRVMGERVVISLIADGRREMETLLMNRLLARDP